MNFLFLYVESNVVMLARWLGSHRADNLLLMGCLPDGAGDFKLNSSARVEYTSFPVWGTGASIKQRTLLVGASLFYGVRHEKN
jgi:hypothetical protein